MAVAFEQEAGVAVVAFRQEVAVACGEEVVAAFGQQVAVEEEVAVACGEEEEEDGGREAECLVELPQ